MRTNTKICIIATLVLLLSLSSAGVFSVALAASVGRHGLSYTDRAEDGDPPQVALGIAMGAFRGIFVNYLWIRATQAKEDGRYFEAIELADAITQLQPRFPRVWVFHAWNMAYNISVTTQTPEERWHWVNAGIQLMRDQGLRANPNDMLMHKELGWIFLHKIGGYTDDSNQYYKRQLAREWQEVLGQPPEFDYSTQSREKRKQLFVDWLRPIVDAPETLAGLRERNPAAARIADQYAARLGIPPGKDLLSRAALLDALERHGQLEAAISEFSQVASMGPNWRAFREIWEDPANAAGWDDLLAHVRRRVLIDDYNMDPLVMLRLTENFGAIDWRLPGAHGFYWAYSGARKGQMEVDERNSAAFDFVNTYRVAVQSLQDLWRFGTLYFNYLDVVRGGAGYYQAVPNPDFLESYGNILEAEAIDAAGIFESERRVYRPYAAGYENLMEDAVTFYYRRGNLDAAERWYERLRTWEGANAHAPADRIERLSLPVDEFVQANVQDRQDSPTVVVQEVFASLQSAYIQGLLFGDEQVFRGMFDFAIAQHRYYHSAQFREIVAGGNTTRTEYLDRDFRFVAGMMFAQIAIQLPPEEAELIYFNAPDDLKRYAYVALTERYQRILEQTGETRPIDEIFPPPPGMDEFRQQLLEKLRERGDQGIEGIQEK